MSSVGLVRGGRDLSLLRRPALGQLMVMTHREQHVLENAIRLVTEQAAKADALVDEAIDVGHGRSDPLVTHAKMLRLELLNVKADLERELQDFSLNFVKCGLDVHWVSGLGITPGYWAHAEPAPHGEPAV